MMRLIVMIRMVTFFYGFAGRMMDGGAAKR